MIRTISAACLALTLAAPAFAANSTQITITASSKQALRAKLVEAANQVCAAALARDPFGDFGSQEECVENSMRAARASRMSFNARQASNDVTQTRAVAR